MCNYKNLGLQVYVDWIHQTMYGAVFILPLCDVTLLLKMLIQFWCQIDKCNCRDVGKVFSQRLINQMHRLIKRANNSTQNDTLTVIISSAIS